MAWTIPYSKINTHKKSIDNHDDVEITSPSDGEVLTYEAATSKWKNQAPTPAAHALDDHTDVEISSPSDGEVLTYEAATSTWKNAAAPPPGAHASTHECGGSDPITGVICPSGLKHPDSYQIIMDVRGTNYPCLRPQYDGYGDLGKASYKWAYIYANYLGTSSYRITNAYLDNLYVYSLATMLCSLRTRDILVDKEYTIQLPRVSGYDAYMKPYSAGYSYVGDSTSYFKEMHATNFVTHSFKPITTPALEKLLKIDLTDKLTFPEDTLILPDKPHDWETIVRRLTDQLGRKPTKEETEEELAKPEYKGINLVQLCGYLIEAVKELKNQVDTLKEQLQTYATLLNKTA
ncbi:MAG: hypothetical protein DRJ03_09360 [Chloroflexi bacterium]|nr:MAG: hypothetical protein DRJ03_09360 [Chloroflexota bacterium]